jgi:hypothetical protein
MAKLTTKTRDHLANSTFALPAQRKYPIPDIAHARDALARVAANGTSTEQTAVRNAVRKKYPSIKVTGGKH